MVQRKEDPIKTNVIVDQENSNALVTFNPNNPDEAANAIKNSNALNQYQAVAYGGNDGGRTRYEDISTNISVRNEFNRGDYEAYRSGERVPKRAKSIINACDKAYKKVGIVRNVIDLMADFGCQGVSVAHENKRVQRFAQKWFTHNANGEQVTERFLNYLYRLGTVVVQRHMSKISLSEERRLSMASEHNLLQETHKSKKPLRTQKRLIPSSYTFLNPMSLEVAGGELAQFAGEQAFGLKLTGRLRTKIASPTNELEKSLVDKLPEELVKAIQDGAKYLPLDSKRIASFSYKKDDWDLWASPMLESILDDLMVLEKMKLADLAALDGAISQIRVWRLGDLDKGILPTDAAIQKLADILLSNPGGGAFDLIWGPELNFEEVTTSVHNFLGSTKYEPILDSIFSGLGVPPTLTGSSRVGGATNNFISLQTLVQRLEYGRKQVEKFWQGEFELLRQAMGFAKAPTIQFDHMILKDEASEKALLIQLLDRNLVSEEMVLDTFGAIPEIEKSRRKREQRERDSGKRTEKLGPYSSDKMHELVRIALGKGLITPEDAGLEIETPDEPQEAEPPSGDEQQNFDDSKTGKPGEGRPINSKDAPGLNRDRSFKPRTSAGIATDMTNFLNCMSWAKSAQSSISSIITPGILKHYNKKNLRSLSSSECIELESVKFNILANLKYGSEITESKISDILSSKPKTPKTFKDCYASLYSSHVNNVKREPTVDELRNIQAASYAICNEI